MIYKTNKKDVEKYFASEALSQSRLKKLLVGVDNFTSEEKEEELYYKEKNYFINGSAVDCMLTGEEGQFEEEYYISQLETKPSDTIMSVIKETFDSVINELKKNIYNLKDEATKVSSDLEDHELTLVEKMNSHEYCTSMKLETRLKRIYEAGEKNGDLGKRYFKELLNSHGKQILSSEERQLIDNIVISLKTNETTKQYFDKDLYRENQSLDIYYQLPIYFTYKDINCKALLDIVIVTKDDKGNIIEIQPVDLKTMHGSTLSFLQSSFKVHRYDIQAAWYTLALKAMFGEKTQIKPFKFIVESTSFIKYPLEYTLTEEVQTIGLYGREKIYASAIHESVPSTLDILLRKEIFGIEDLIADYLWYSENGWDTERKIKNSNSQFKLYWDEIM